MSEFYDEYSDDEYHISMPSSILADSLRKNNLNLNLPDTVLEVKSHLQSSLNTDKKENHNLDFKQDIERVEEGESESKTEGESKPNGKTESNNIVSKNC
jgi:hypothetical protein